MCGMKTGAGEDPFADEPEENDDDDEHERGGAGGAAFERKEPEESRRDRDTEPDPPAGGDDGRVEAAELPYIARRNARGDNVKAGRETRRLFELRPDVAERESAFMDELEAELGTDVPKTDAREAALAVVYERPGLVADRLEEWGINYFEDE